MKEHSYNNHHGAYRHICSYCDRSGRALQHPEVKCNSKNESKDRQTVKSLGRGLIDNYFPYNSIVCSNTDFDMDVNVNFCHKEETSLELADESGRGKYVFRDFDKAHNNVVFSNTINSNSSLYSVNLFSGPLGHCCDKNIDMFTGQSSVNNLASPPVFHYIKDCCIYGNRSDETYIWPF